MENNYRCGWCEKDDLYRDYHDKEWGQPIHDDRIMFEFLLLETFRSAFDNFDFERISRYSESKIQTLLQDSGIIRNQQKIRAAVSNAQAYLKVREEFGSFCSYFWSFTNGEPIDNTPQTLADIPTSTALSDMISKDLKKRGFTFVGSTVVYAHMQATGMVNDHVAGCWKRK